MYKYFLTCIVLGELLMGRPANAQTCKPESIPATTPTSQFADNQNGTVTDKLTGLMWKKCSEGQIWDNTNGCSGDNAYYTWQNALKQAQIVNTSGGFASYTDWRVPNKNELISIVEEQCEDPAINLSIFLLPNTSNYLFWSSSPVAGNDNDAWHVDFNYGNDSNGGWSLKDYVLQVRLVRSG